MLCNSVFYSGLTVCSPSSDDGTTVYRTNVPSCWDPPTLLNGACSYMSKRVGSSITYSCDTAYTFQGISPNALCTEDGVWAGFDGMCELVDCGAPTSVPNSQAVFTDTTYSSSVTFPCDLGFEFSGSSQQATCDISGQWVGFSGSCDAVDCGTPTPVPNTQAVLTDTTYSSTVTFTCDLGYDFSGTSQQATCDVSGQWVGFSGSCDAVNCGPPAAQPNAQSVFTDTTYSSTVTFTCNLAHMFSGSSQQATCDENGLWVGFSGSCGVVTDCRDIHDINPTAASGVYSILPTVGSGPISVYCDMTDDGGGWTVLQRRTDGSEDFLRNWDEYRNGFGTLGNEFWLGNTNIWRLTNQRNYELMVDLEDFGGDRRYASYSQFSLSHESDEFRLNVGGYSGNAGDSLSPLHNNMRFTTIDNDNDNNFLINCAFTITGGWWFNNCHEVNLNGQYDRNSMQGVNWRAFKDFTTLKYSAMKIRPDNNR